MTERKRAPGRPRLERNESRDKCTATFKSSDFDEIIEAAEDESRVSEYIAAAALRSARAKNRKSRGN